MKLARVNLEAEVWGDPRFPHLERLLGYPPCSGHLAIARMAMIWGWQVEHYTPEVPCFHAPEEIIEMALEVDGPTAIAALVRARLAEETPEGVRMKGANHESTGWLWRVRQRSAAGVDAKKQKASTKRKSADVSQPVVDPRFTTGEPQVNPLSSLLSDLPESLSLGVARDPGAPPLATGTVPSAPAVHTEPDDPPTASVAGPGPFAPLRQHVALAVELLNAARAELDPRAQPIAATPGDDMAAAGHLRAIPEAKREPAIRHGVAAITARVRLGMEPFSALRPSELFGPRAWGKYQADSLDELRRATERRSRGGDGPGGRASPPRGQAPPARGSSAGRALVARLEAEEAARRPQEPDP